MIQQNGVSQLSEYLRVPRIGRSQRMSRLTRKAIWPVFEEYRALLDRNHRKEWIDMTRDARILLEQAGDILPYKAIVVDEAQDMNPESFKLLRQMIPQQQPNDLFIVGDAHQRIYENKIVLSHCGIHIRGRARRLRINYRTTEETRQYATNLLHGIDFDDLDGGEDRQTEYKSLTHGSKPQVRRFDSFADEVNALHEIISALQQQGTELKNICLVCRTHQLLGQYQGALESRNIPVYPISRNKAEDRNADGLRLATLHRVKGLEFDHMIIAGANHDVIPLPQMTGDPVRMTLERSLLYVAITRARKSVVITGHGVLSSFLEMKEK